MIDIGQRVGNYKVISKLGEGGMGMVFLAEHPLIGSRVALKAIHPRFARSADAVARFVNEAKVVNQIRHDHIVDISDFGRTKGGDFYFLMEYLEGESLSASIGRQGAFPVARALHVAAQIADALHASHENGVVHRDVKPDNVHLIPRGETMDFVKVLDFGLAKLTHDAEAPVVDTVAGLVMGSPDYMSPEQCDGRSAVDHRSDVYALGIILFEMLTGRAPFHDISCREVLVRQLTARPPSVRTFVPELPATLDAILERALAKDPAARFQTMAEFGAALRDPRVLAVPELPPAAPTVECDDRDLRPKRNHGPLVTVATFAAAAACVFLLKANDGVGHDLLRGAIATATRALSPAAPTGPVPSPAKSDGPAIAATLPLDSGQAISAARSSARVPAFSAHQRRRQPSADDAPSGSGDVGGSVLAPSTP